MDTTDIRGAEAARVRALEGCAGMLEQMLRSLLSMKACTETIISDAENCLAVLRGASASVAAAIDADIEAQMSRFDRISEPALIWDGACVHDRVPAYWWLDPSRTIKHGPFSTAEEARADMAAAREHVA